MADDTKVLIDLADGDPTKVKIELVPLSDEELAQRAKDADDAARQDAADAAALAVRQKDEDLILAAAQQNPVFAAVARRLGIKG